MAEALARRTEFKKLRLVTFIGSRADTLNHRTMLKSIVYRHNNQISVVIEPGAS